MHTDCDRQAGVNQSGRSHTSSKHDCLFEEERGGGSSTSRLQSITSLAALHQALPAPLLIPVCLPSDDELLDLQEEYGDRYISPGCPGDSSPRYSPKVLIFRRPGHYAYRSGHSKAQIFAEDLFGILPREMVLGPSSLLFRRVLLPQSRRRPDLRQLFSQGLGFPTLWLFFIYFREFTESESKRSRRHWYLTYNLVMAVFHNG